MKITKKILPESFQLIVDGQKTCEVRLADWECSTGDELELVEIDEKTKGPTGRVITRKVGQVVKTKDVSFFAKEEVEKHGYQIISLLDE